MLGCWVSSIVGSPRQEEEGGGMDMVKQKGRIVWLECKDEQGWRSLLRHVEVFSHDNRS